MNSLESLLLRISFLALIVLLALVVLVLLKPLSFLWFTPYIILSALTTLSTYCLRVLVGNKSSKEWKKLILYPFSLLPLALYVYVWMLGNSMEDSWLYILASTQIAAVVGISQKLELFSSTQSKAYEFIGLLTFCVGIALSLGFLLPFQNEIYFLSLMIVMVVFSLSSLTLSVLKKN